MPDSLPRRLAPEAATVADAIRRARKPLPPHDLKGVNFRTWAAAVCQAEVNHRARDFARVERELGLSFDRWLDPSAEEIGQFPHERHAASVLNWLSHLATHDSDRHGPWAKWHGWPTWTREQRVAWVKRRRTLVWGILKGMKKYLKDAQALPALLATDRR